MGNIDSLLSVFHGSSYKNYQGSNPVRRLKRAREIRQKIDLDRRQVGNLGTVAEMPRRFVIGIFWKCKLIDRLAHCVTVKGPVIRDIGSRNLLYSTCVLLSFLFCNRYSLAYYGVLLSVFASKVFFNFSVNCFPYIQIRHPSFPHQSLVHHECYSFSRRPERLHIAGRRLHKAY